jgi:hypothetical protein
LAVDIPACPELAPACATPHAGRLCTPAGADAAAALLPCCPAAADTTRSALLSWMPTPACPRWSCPLTWRARARRRPSTSSGWCAPLGRCWAAAGPLLGRCWAAGCGWRGWAALLGWLGWPGCCLRTGHGGGWGREYPGRRAQWLALPSMLHAHTPHPPAAATHPCSASSPSPCPAGQAPVPVPARVALRAGHGRCL